jgi:hypothetical protein
MGQCPAPIQYKVHGFSATRQTTTVFDRLQYGHTEVNVVHMGSARLWYSMGDVLLASVQVLGCQGSIWLVSV